MIRLAANPSMGYIVGAKFLKPRSLAQPYGQDQKGHFFGQGQLTPFTI